MKRNNNTKHMPEKDRRRALDRREFGIVPYELPMMMLSAGFGPLFYGFLCQDHVVCL